MLFREVERTRTLWPLVRLECARAAKARRRWGNRKKHPVVIILSVTVNVRVLFFCIVYHLFETYDIKVWSETIVTTFLL